MGVMMLMTETSPLPREPRCSSLCAIWSECLVLDDRDMHTSHVSFVLSSLSLVTFLHQ